MCSSRKQKREGLRPTIRLLQPTSSPIWCRSGWHPNRRADPAADHYQGRGRSPRHQGGGRSLREEDSRGGERDRGSLPEAGFRSGTVKPYCHRSREIHCRSRSQNYPRYFGRRRGGRRQRRYLFGIHCSIALSKKRCAALGGGWHFCREREPVIGHRRACSNSRQSMCVINR